MFDNLRVILKSHFFLIFWFLEDVINQKSSYFSLSDKEAWPRHLFDFHKIGQDDVF